MQLTLERPKVDHKAFGLSKKQGKFARELLNSTLPQYKVYMEVFGTKSVPSAKSGSSKLVAKDNFKKYMAALEAQVANDAIERAAISEERVLSEEACLAFLDVADFVNEEGFFIRNIRDIPEQARRAIAGIEITERIDPNDGQPKPYFKIKIANKGSALERLEKHLGMLNQKIEVGVELTFKELVKAIDGKATGQPMIPHLK